MNEHDIIRLRHMMDAATEAVSFLLGRTQADLGRDRMFLLALIKEVEIIGEAASRVSAETRELSPEVPWRNIVSMRNRLIHAYADVDLEIVWETVSAALPELILSLRGVLERADKPSGRTGL